MPNYSSSLKQRIFGLDFVRALSILWVLFIHYTPFLDKYVLSAPTPSIIHFDPIDFFFVLSGFLIGNLVLKELTQHNTFGISQVRLFFKRRWFRTLPNYFLFLIINIVLIQLDLIPGIINKYLVTFFIFCQNLIIPFDFLFWESWSLAIEEWFYLSFPILIFLSIRISKNGLQAYLFSTLMLIVIPTVIRIFSASDGNDFDIYTRKIVVNRLDTIAYGLIGAYVYRIKNDIWTKFRHPLFLSGLIIILYLIFNPLEKTFFSRTFAFSLSAFGIILLFPVFSNWHSKTFLARAVTLISKISYSVYLLHQIIIHLMLNDDMAAAYNPKMLLIISIAIIFIGSYLIYRNFELPITNLRDR